MGTIEWLTLVGVALMGFSASLPWTFMVHGRLAAMGQALQGLDGTVRDLRQQITKIFDREDQRQCARHAAELLDLSRRLDRLERLLQGAPHEEHEPRNTH